jgi:hypothetical protein
MIDVGNETEALRADLSRGRARELHRTLTCDYNKNVRRFFRAFTSGKQSATNQKSEMRLVKRFKRAAQHSSNILISELVDFLDGKYFVWQSWAPKVLENDDFGVALISVEIGVNQRAWNEMDDHMQERPVLFIRQHVLQRLCERSENPESDLLDILMFGNICLRASIYTPEPPFTYGKDVLIPTCSGAVAGHVFMTEGSCIPHIISNTFLSTSQLKPEQRSVRAQLLDTIHDAEEEEIFTERSSLILVDGTNIKIDDTVLWKELAPIMHKLPHTHSELSERLSNTTNDS